MWYFCAACTKRPFILHLDTIGNCLSVFLLSHTIISIPNFLTLTPRRRVKIITHLRVSLLLMILCCAPKLTLTTTLLTLEESEMNQLLYSIDIKTLSTPSVKVLELHAINNQNSQSSKPSRYHHIANHQNLYKIAQTAVHTLSSSIDWKCLRHC